MRDVESEGWIGRKEVGEDALVCVHIYRGPASLRALLLWVRMLTRSTWVDRSVMLEHGATLIPSYAPMVQVPAFGVTTLLTFSAPLSSPVLSVDFSSGDAGVWPHACAPTYPSLRDFPQPWIQGAGSFMENFGGLISW